MQIVLNKNFVGLHLQLIFTVENETVMSIWGTYIAMF